MRIFIGSDSRQPLAYTVLRSSIERRAGARVQIEPLRLDLLPIKRKGLTEFTYSRYLVPWLCGYEGHALFMDGDMLARSDILEIERLADPLASVTCVKSPHRYQWTSLMYFNNAACRALTPELVETGHPQSMGWAERIGALPSEWNHLVGYDAPRADAKIVHFTQGIPCWPETENCEHADAWREELAYATGSVSWAALMGRSVHASEVLKSYRPLKEAS